MAKEAEQCGSIGVRVEADRAVSASAGIGLGLAMAFGVAGSCRWVRAQYASDVAHLLELREDRGLELANVSQDLKLIEESHGDNVLNLVAAVGYLRSLLANSRVVKFLGQHYANSSNSSVTLRPSNSAT